MRRRTTLFLSMLIGMLIFPLWQLRADESPFCYPIRTSYDQTPYFQLKSRWRWINSNTVIFSVGIGNSFVGHTAWYEYHTSTAELVELPSTPYDEVIVASVPAESLLFIPKYTWGLYEDVFVSPLGQQFVYKEYDPKTAITQYWYDDRQTGIRIALNIEPQAYNQWLNEWTADAHRFVLHPIYGLPMYVVTIKDSQAVVEDLSKILSLRWLAEGYKTGPGANLTIKGMSPDGHYILGQPDTMDRISWVFIWDEARYEILNFSLDAGEGISWLNNTTFVARTNLGVVEYDLAQRKMKIRPTTGSLGHFRGHLSPDGRFIIGEYRDKNYTMKEFRICRVG